MVFVTLHEDSTGTSSVVGCRTSSSRSVVGGCISAVSRVVEFLLFFPSNIDVETCLELFEGNNAIS